MNERIRELKKQATKIVETTDHCTGVSESRIEVDLEKFAQLIVRECVRYFNEDYQRDFNALWREDLTKGIKDHFGVE